MIPDIKDLKLVYSYITFDERPEEVQARKNFKVDNTTGYLVSALKKIENGKLKGTLKPLVEPNSLPDFTKVYAGQIEIYPGLYSSGIFTDSYIQKHHRRISFGRAMVIWILAVVIIIFIYLLIKK